MLTDQIRRPVRKLRAKSNDRIRPPCGHSISEMGPALWILIVAFFLPTIALMGLGLSYASVVLLNNLQVHEASVVPYDQAQDPSGTVMQTIPNNWMTSGVGQFVNPVSLPDTEVSYKLGTKGGSQVQDYVVVVKTTVSVPPLVSVPFFQNVPGLSAPVTYAVTGESILENQDNAPPPDSVQHTPVNDQ